MVDSFGGFTLAFAFCIFIVVGTHGWRYLQFVSELARTMQSLYIPDVDAMYGDLPVVMQRVSLRGLPRVIVGGCV